MIYADVIVPLPLRGTFTYSVSSDIVNDVHIGSRVIVQFGKRKFYTAIVQNIYDRGQPIPGTKEIVSLLDKEPIILPAQITFWEWIAAYYMCNIGDVLKAALPSALKLESETLVFKNPDFESISSFTPNEEKIFFALDENRPLQIAELSRITKISNIGPYIKSLSDKDAVFINENVKDKYALKTETAIALAKDFSDKELAYLLDSLKRARKQFLLLTEFLFRKGDKGFSDYHILKKDLLDSGFSISSLNSLIEKKILKAFLLGKNRISYNKNDEYTEKSLNEFQRDAYSSIKNSFENKNVTLFHGVTSSGKTEIYINLIKEYLDKGEQVLYLLPEIALTAQITERLKNVFGDKMVVYHSKFSDNERADAWKSLLNIHPKQLILGVRSSIFLPFQNLGLIIVDEEHESSYKQQDPAPRYNARDSAIYLAHIHKSKVLLGTATPSMESFYNARNGKYGYVSLKKRYSEISLPQVEVINIKELRRKKMMKTVISPPLAELMQRAISNREQVILFQNRRGFAPFMECKLCGYTPKCDHCDVSLTYHKNEDILMCHYCGATYTIPNGCPECQSYKLEVLGYGTERVEEEVSQMFPDSKILRMDLDTTRSKYGYEKIINEFAANNANILIGTQMVSKGLDFENVSVVGILNADSMLNFPDFRAYEKAYQMMVQVSGRAGRKNKQGTVVLQTTQPDHPVINYVKNNDYESLYGLQIEERKLFSYPPFYRIIEITLKSKDKIIVQKNTGKMAYLLRNTFGDKVLGPSAPVVSRVRNLYIRKILLKVDTRFEPQKVRDAIDFYKQKITESDTGRSLLINYNVDPL